MSVESKNHSIRKGGVLALVVALLAAGGCAARRPGPITDENLAERITQAKTFADHEALAHYFHEQANEQAALQAKHYQAIVNSYKESTSDADDSPARERIRQWMRQHCRGLVESYRRLEEKYLALAEDHARMAREIEAGR